VDFAVLTLGNSGAGKSLLDNILLGKHQFVHESSADSCTSEVEHVVVERAWGEDGARKTFAVFNIPGLLEIDKDKIERNKNAIKAAFGRYATVDQFILFVLGNDGGRPRGADAEAFSSMLEAYELQTESVLFVCNRKPRNPKPNSEAYEAQFISLFKTATKWEERKLGKLKATFVEDLNMEDPESNDFYMKPKVKEIETRIGLNLLCLCKPHVHTQVKSLILDSERAAKLQKELEENAKQYRDSMAMQARAIADLRQMVTDLEQRNRCRLM